MGTDTHELPFFVFVLFKLMCSNVKLLYCIILSTQNYTVLLSTLLNTLFTLFSAIQKRKIVKNIKNELKKQEVAISEV